MTFRYVSRYLVSTFKTKPYHCETTFKCSTLNNIICCKTSHIMATWCKISIRRGDDNCAILDCSQRHLVGLSWIYLRYFWFGDFFVQNAMQNSFWKIFLAAISPISPVVRLLVCEKLQKWQNNNNNNNGFYFHNASI